MKAVLNSTNGDILYGPYIITEPSGTSMLGRTYTASFRLKVSSNAYASSVVCIDVSYNLGPVLTGRLIKANEFAASGAWQSFDLIFTVPYSLSAR